MNPRSRILSWCFVGAVGACLFGYVMIAAAGRQEDEQGFHYQAFGRLPVLDHGRVKPFDTLARVSLMVISGRQEYRDEKGDAQPATRWLLDLMTARHKAASRGADMIGGASGKVKAYRIDDPGVRQALNLPAGDDMLSLEDIFAAAGMNRLRDFMTGAADLRKRHSDKANEAELLAALDGHERAVVELSARLYSHMSLSEIETPHKVFRIDNPEVLAVLGLEERPGFRYGFDEFLPRLADLEREARRAKEIKPRDQTLFDAKALETFRHADLYVGLANGNAESLHLVAPGEKGGEFQTLEAAARALAAEGERGGGGDRAAGLFRDLLRSYADGDKARFNKAVAAYDALASKALPAEAPRAATEAGFNAFAPFSVCTVLYVTLFVVVAVSWLWREPALGRFAFWATLLTALIHTWALLERMHIQQRPPVTNLYSSAVFIGWVCVLVTLAVEWIYRNGLSLAVGTVTGALTLFIAHHLGGSGDTMEELQAVLDTNFWLATHVTCVTIGYSATFVAGFFGIATILAVVGSAALRAAGIDAVVDGPALKLLGRCVYGVVCFATLFSFVGTVLGGIWADYSWGRFWGWDPKENGALLIVIMNSLILHARWGGLVKERGMAALAVAGNVVTMWSWFGTNQLGIGLHAYGFNDTLVLLCRYFWLSQLAVIGLAALPLKAWRPPFAPALKAAPAPVRGRPQRGQIVPGGAT